MHNITQPGSLYIVATPIGNLGDITQRALAVLAAVDGIYAEDTRVSQKILERYGIKNQLRSYREAAPHNVLERLISEIEFRLGQGESLALLSDAGTPGVSDPGRYLVKRLREAGFAVVPLPGPSALTALLSATGLAVQRPLFVGFLPKKKGHQTLMGQLAAGLKEGVFDGIVFYESPERILKLLQELQTWNIDLSVCLGRELTKLHEEILEGPLPEIYTTLTSRASIKGEIVLLIARP